MITYYSTNRKVPEVDLGKAMLQGQAADKGLFMPRPLPRFSQELLRRSRELSYPELAAAVLEPYAAGVFSADILGEICRDAYDFEVPLEKIDGALYVMRLDRGPTASFKDFAARFMGRAMGRLVQQQGSELLILTATSGDTGSAVAQAFFRVPGIRVLVLFPRAEVSDRQRQQMTTLGDNVSTLAVAGKFDDCQALVKQAFADPQLAKLHLSSANSINIGRLIPQAVYYVYAASRLADLAAGEEVIFSVPCGNFGDLLGGTLAARSGLPVKRFIIATNANDEVPVFFQTGNYRKIVPSKQCISNAMNVGHPSNLARLIDLYGGWMDEQGNLLNPPDWERLRRDFYALSIDDHRTRQMIGEVFRRHRTFLEPHGAVAWAGLLQYMENHPAEKKIKAISLETAHPAKFPDEIRSLTGQDPPLPPSLSGLESRAERFGEMAVDYRWFKEHLLREYV